ncbi:helicase domain protein [Staphylococcus aureus]|nr:helicase domain protein [Staphylococcus aureus]
MEPFKSSESVLVLGTPKERNDALNTEADIYVTNKEILNGYAINIKRMAI